MISGSQQSPLSGVTVLDLSRVLSGPFATQQLIDLGASVIKIEHPEHGDDTRAFGPPFVAGESTYFLSINRGKRSVAIDLKAERGQALVRGLALSADVVMENFRPNTLERLNLSLQMLRASTPALITCSINGYGATGDPSWSRRPGYDAIIQAASGIMSTTGEIDGAPVRVGLAIADLVAGLFAAQGILAALYARHRTGIGQHVEVSMLEAMGAILTYQAGIYFGTGQTPPRMGNAHPSICPYQTIEAKDGPFMLAVGNNVQFVRLCEVLGLPELPADPRFADNPSRVAARTELLRILEPVFRTRTRSEWDDRLAKAGVPGGPVLDVASALAHPQLVARGGILQHTHARAGTIRSMASAVRFDDRPPEVVPAPPILGEHTVEVLRERLGLGEEEIADLVADGIVFAA